MKSKEQKERETKREMEKERARENTEEAILGREGKDRMHKGRREGNGVKKLEGKANSK